MPTLAIISEILLQYLEHKKITPLLQSYIIIAYYRYIDTILIIYNENLPKFKAHYRT
jgi:hypothetical protein